MFTLFSSRHIRGLRTEVHRHGGSIPSSIILRGTFRRISKLWDNSHTLNLKNCLLYLSSIISQFLDFIHWMFILFNFFIANEHTQFFLLCGSTLLDEERPGTELETSLICLSRTDLAKMSFGVIQFSRSFWSIVNLCPVWLNLDSVSDI